MLTPTEADFIFQEAEIDTVVSDQAGSRATPNAAVRIVNIGELIRTTTVSAPFEPCPAGNDETAMLLYTSGTTGRPKGVPLTHRNLLSNACGLGNRLEVQSTDVVIAVLPMFHAFGLMGQMIMPLLVGAEVVQARFTPRRIIETMAQHQATVFVGVPSLYRILLRAKMPATPIQRLRLAISGGDALPSRVRDDFQQRFNKPLLEGYGLTETSPVITVNTPQEHRAGTVGRALPDVQVRIATEGGTAQPGAVGEVQVRGPNVMSGYYCRPDENARAFTSDGWFRTGDLGYQDSDGYLTISGRLKELIVRDGEKIMPREVEEVLEQHPGVVEAAVIGEPDGARGEAVVAFVATAEAPPTSEELRLFCRCRLAEFKVPRRIILSSEFPRPCYRGGSHGRKNRTCAAACRGSSDRIGGCLLEKLE
jgi:long-chain acyl-CoA synthetase